MINQHVFKLPTYDPAPTLKLIDMLKISIFVAFAIGSLSLLAQVKINGRVVNQDNRALQNVHIAVINEAVGTYSDNTGSFELDVSQRDTILFSMIGYASLMLNAKDVEKKGIIQLQEVTYSINPIDITWNNQKSKKTKTVRIGTLNEKKDIYMNRPKGNQVAVFMPHPNYDKTYLKKAVFRFSSNYGEKKRNCGNIRINIFEVNPYTKGPGREMLKREIIRKVCPGEKWVEIDLLQEFILMPIEGVFVGFEFLGEVNKKGTPKLGPYNVWPEYFHTRNKALPTWTWGKYWGQEWGLERGENALLGLDVVCYE